MFIPDPGSGFFPIPDPGVKKAPDPGSGSATLNETHKIFILNFCGATLFWCGIFKTVHYDPTVFKCPINQWNVFYKVSESPWDYKWYFHVHKLFKRVPGIPFFSFYESEKFFVSRNKKKEKDRSRSRSRRRSRSRSRSRSGSRDKKKKKRKDRSRSRSGGGDNKRKERDEAEKEAGEVHSDGERKKVREPAFLLY